MTEEIPQVASAKEDEKLPISIVLKAAVDDEPLPQSTNIQWDKFVKHLLFCHSVCTKVTIPL